MSYLDKPLSLYFLNNKNLRTIENIDILEQDIAPSLLKILLQDKTTGCFIRFGCDEYAKYGQAYTAEKEIFPNLITGKRTKIIQPRIAKTKNEQLKRTREAAEVFTPSWLCNEMISHCDEVFFKRKNVFNTLNGQTWQPVLEHISFPDNLHWTKYVDLRHLEITCGEAPYLVSRYDTTTGVFLPIEKRIGILDRKLRIISENTRTEEEWYKWARRAFESTYGYEYQGDNLLLARENLLWTFIDYYKHTFHKEPSLNRQKQIANIISWNIWQMDGLTGTVPFSTAQTSPIQPDLFANDIPKIHIPLLCKIKNWRSDKSCYFNEMKGAKKMKFDVVIGNPPYQETKEKTATQTQGNSTWIYHFFQFSADEIGDYSCLIYPFGGWFDSPERLNGLGTKILTDNRTILIKAYEGTTDKRAWYRNDKEPQPPFGTNANLSAGVSIVLRGKTKRKEFLYSNRIYSDITVNIAYNETQDLPPNPIFINTYKKLGKGRLFSQIKKGVFGIESDYVEKNPKNVSFNKEDWEHPIQLLTNDKSGSSGRATCYWTDEKYIPKGKEYLDYYKIIMTSAYPKKTIVSGKPTIENVKKRIDSLIEILPPQSAFGRSRLSLFMSKNKTECDNFLKYTKTNFFAGLVLQEPNRRSSFGFVIPLQDFTSKSDIDWSKSIHEIDLQLYKKYGLDETEINFIETHVKEMA